MFPVAETGLRNSEPHSSLRLLCSRLVRVMTAGVPRGVPRGAQGCPMGATSTIGTMHAPIVLFRDHACSNRTMHGPNVKLTFYVYKDIIYIGNSTPEFYFQGLLYELAEDRSGTLRSGGPNPGPQRQTVSRISFQRLSDPSGRGFLPFS